ncbi:MAG: hypothetical protein LUQ07_02055 [Methanospirillum sp.]|nr:hypothetical protein [Methanospirillum sp.]
MLQEEVSPEMVESWKATYDHYRNRLKPDRRPVSEVIAYLTGKYPVTELTDAKSRQVVIDNVILNTYYGKKIPAGRVPLPVVFVVEDTGAGRSLYEEQDDLYRGNRIIVGFEHETGYFLVEGNSQLWDELFVYRGLDEDDITNYYLVAEYIRCLKKTGNLDGVLSC